MVPRRPAPGRIGPVRHVLAASTALLAWAHAVGCSTITLSPPEANGRSAINQRVATAAIERALRSEGLSFGSMSGKRVRVDVGGTTGGHEEDYVRTAVSGRLARVGALPVYGDVPADATLLVSIRSAGTDLNGTGGFLGSLLAPLVHYVGYEGRAKLRIVAIGHDGRILLEAPNLEGDARYQRAWVLLVLGPLGWDDSDDPELDS